MKNYYWDAITSYMNDDLREEVHAELAPCSPKDFLARYLELDPDFQDLLTSRTTFPLIVARSISSDRRTRLALTMRNVRDLLAITILTFTILCRRCEKPPCRSYRYTEPMTQSDRGLAPGNAGRAGHNPGHLEKWRFTP